MDTLSAAYQFTADAFRHFIIRTLTDDIRKRKLTAVCSHQTRIGNLDAHLI